MMEVIVIMEQREWRLSLARLICVYFEMLELDINDNYRTLYEVWRLFQKYGCKSVAIRFHLKNMFSKSK